MSINITSLLLLLGCMQLSARSLSQTINYRGSAEPLGEVLAAVEAQTGYFVVYNTKIVSSTKPTTITAVQMPLEEFLNKVLKPQSLKYTIDENTILITKMAGARVPGPPIVKNGNQQREITGTVTSEQGEALEGVTVSVKGTALATTTDSEGRYYLSLPADVSGSLVFTIIGYETLEVQVSSGSEVSVSLKQQISDLEEVVVVGYGTARKETLTGSITTVTGSDITNVPATNASQTLSGKLAGVSAIARGGEPGNDAATIRIRGVNTLGDNTPLVVVDGIPGRSLERIDPNSIESLTVLKDASAAIYGSQAANGVILITTKRGKSGKPQISVNLNYGLSRPTVIPKMANSAQYATALNEIDMYRGRTPRFSEEDIQKFADGSDPWSYPNTDWFVEVFKPWTGQSNSDVSVSGGSETMRYFTNIGVKTQDGYYKRGATRYNQYNLRTNLDFDVNENISLGLDVLGRIEDARYPGRGSTGTIMNSLMRGKPNMVAYWPNGLLGPDIERGENPAAMVTDATGLTRNRNYIVNTNLKLNIKIPGVEGLSVSANGSFDKGFRYNKQFQTPWYLYSWDGISYDENQQPLLISGIKGINDPNLTQSFENRTTYMVNALINYDRRFGDDHDFKFLAGTEVRAGDRELFDAYRRYFISTEIDQLDAGGKSEINNGGTGSHDARLNYFGRVNYGYKSKYLAEFVWRVDGSYIFPKAGRYGFFPGVSLGWRMSEENFWKEGLGFINDAKLRLSYGQTGNDRIAEWQYLSTYNISPSGYVFDITEEAQTIVEARIPNPHVTWEVANQANVGLDLALLQNKLSVSLDYFDYRRSQILWQRNASVPASTGLSLPRENIGKLKNTGFDVSIGYRDNIGTVDFGVSLNGGYSKNEITFWDETPGVPEYQRSTGRPMPTDVNNPDNDLYYQAIGIFRDQEAVDAYPHWGGARPGDVIFEDVNNDGVIDALDRVRSEYNDVPRLTGGLQLNLGWKRFTFSALIQGQAGAVRFLRMEWGGDYGNYILSDYEDRWTPDNIDATKPRAFNRTDEYFRGQRSTQYLFKTDFLRLKNVELGYSLPDQFVEKLGLQQLRVFASGFNVLTYSPSFKDFDPEDNNSGGMNYPPSKIFNFGISTTF